METERQLIAPCGMFCGLCSSYLAYSHQVPREGRKHTYCTGCRPRGKQCAFLKKRCARLQSQTVQYCFQCPSYPCERLQRLAEGYRKTYGLDFLRNLGLVQEQGEDALLQALRDRYGCERCGGLRSVHSGKCFHCDEIHSWKD